MSSAANHKKRSCRSAKHAQAAGAQPIVTRTDGFFQRLFSGRARETRTTPEVKE